MGCSKEWGWRFSLALFFPDTGLKPGVKKLVKPMALDIRANPCNPWLKI